MAGRPKEFDPSEALNAAVGAFWARGFEGCSMTVLIDEMSINRQSMYDTFGDKRSLFLEALSAYMEQAGQRMFAALTEGPSPLGRVQAFLRGLGERLVQCEGKGCLLTNTIVEIGPHDPEIRGLIAARWKGLEDLLTRTLQEAVDVGELRPASEPRDLARLVLAVMQGAVVLSKADLGKSVTGAIRCVETLLDGNDAA